MKVNVLHMSNECARFQTYIYYLNEWKFHFKLIAKQKQRIKRKKKHLKINKINII